MNERREEIRNNLVKAVKEHEWCVKDIYNIENTLENIISKTDYSLEGMCHFVKDETKEKIREEFYSFHIKHLTEMVVGELDDARIKMDFNVNPVPVKTLKSKLPKRKIVEETSNENDNEQKKKELRERIRQDTKQI
jgi:hypothetical protein